MLDSSEFCHANSKTGFRDTVSRKPGAKFPPVKGRYHLYHSSGCPWAHRAVLAYKLKGLDDIVTISNVGLIIDEKGWKFKEPDALTGATHMSGIYHLANPEYEGKWTVPVLWDKETKTIVNNESGDLLRFLSTEFDDLLDDKHKNVQLYPEHLRGKIDEFNAWTLNYINGSASKAIYAPTQQAYEEAVTRLEEGLTRLDRHFAKTEGPYVFGKHLTESDVNIFVALCRLDSVWAPKFRTNIKLIREGYQALNSYLQHMYWNEPVFHDNTKFDVIIRTTQPQPPPDVPPRVVSPPILPIEEEEV